MVTRLSVSEAATRLGVSVYTVKRRLISGALKGQRDNSGRWFVLLQDDVRVAVAPAEPAIAGPAAATAVAHVAPGERSLSQPQQLLQQQVDAESALVTELRRQLDYERAQTARQLAERDRQHREMGELWRERADAAELRAEQSNQQLSDLVTKILTSIPAPAPNAESTKISVPWWSRLFGNTTRSNLKG